jgi:N-acetylglutamate synthase-like GNAT family acetyltransferase
MIEIRPPFPNEMENYFHLRWKILRAPWDQPEGSERDQLENESYQLAAVKNESEIVACGRLQLNNSLEAQIRFMAVDTSQQGRGVGKLMIAGLEAEAKRRGASKVILQARENAVAFYQSCGYKVKEKTFLLFNSIQHYLMEKEL